MPETISMGMNKVEISEPNWRIKCSKIDANDCKNK
jgi:hypothetical protein